MKKKNIAIVSGGNSGEYEISIKSGREVAKELDKERYNVFLIVIRE
ncbi:D-alanine--D-alanine ligase, partial [Bacteroidales bacterium OttesenSCG-928-J16]|nr:D-alanine--D-alanine ligase [Bacteroidales bacterium OttesenSCG-928-J16]